MGQSSSLHLKTMGVIGLIILFTVGSAALYNVRDIQKNYLETIEWRSETLAQGIRYFINARYNMFHGLADIDLVLESAYLECKKLYDASRHLNVSFVGILDKNGKIVTHNDKNFWNKRFSDPELLGALGSQEVRTVLVEETYHTLVPVVADHNIRLATIDIGFPKQVVDQKVAKALKKALVLALPMFVGAFALTWLFVRQIVTRPVEKLIDATDHIARGDLTRDINASHTEDFEKLAASLTRMRDSIRRSMEELDRKNLELEALISCSPLALFSTDLSGSVLIWTASAQRQFLWRENEVVGKRLPAIPENEAERFDDLLMEVRRGNVVKGSEVMQKRKDDSLFHASFSSAPIRDSEGSIIGVMSTVEDITERVEREKAHQKTQEQLLQAQKMESVGRLAGGVAHDFNNMLGVILGYGELALELTNPDDQLYKNLQEIMKAAGRSVDIIRQLLAFARKQTVAPIVLDINKTVASMTKMLQRLIGEDIDLAWMPGEDVWPMKIDPSQIDQILANLCVNARDAIADVGKITIETGNVAFDEEYCADKAEFLPGEYVLLAVSDSGCGIDSETLEKIFDPFYTTKEAGKGTGLGLSTVYGIVKQNNGFINVYSEPGQGTTFKIYFARHKAAADVSSTTEKKVSTIIGHETILVVEDEPSILMLTETMLKNLGYTVLASIAPTEAIRLAQEFEGRIDLLITDVIMPEMNGKELAERIAAIHPDAKCLFMSGYTANVIAHHGVLDEEVNFVQKPFSRQRLGMHVREALDGRGAE